LKSWCDAAKATSASL